MKKSWLVGSIATAAIVVTGAGAGYAQSVNFQDAKGTSIGHPALDITKRGSDLIFTGIGNGIVVPNLVLSIQSANSTQSVKSVVSSKSLQSPQSTKSPLSVKSVKSPLSVESPKSPASPKSPNSPKSVDD